MQIERYFIESGGESRDVVDAGPHGEGYALWEKDIARESAKAHEGVLMCYSFEYDDSDEIESFAQEGGSDVR